MPDVPAVPGSPGLSAGSGAASSLEERAVRAFAADGPLAHALPEFEARAGQVAMAAAVANAVYNATGVRVRDYPITLDKLLGNIKRS